MYIFLITNLVLSYMIFYLKSLEFLLKISVSMKNIKLEFKDHMNIFSMKEI